MDFATRLLSVSQTKNGETRHIPLNAAALSAFHQLHQNSSGEGYVFTNRHGDRLLKGRHWFEPAIREAGVKDFSWHCLRHTFASRLVMAGVDLRTVQQLMGHKAIQMTVRYAHLAPEHQMAAVERLCPAAGTLEIQLTPELTPPRLRVLSVNWQLSIKSFGCVRLESEWARSSVGRATHF